MEAFRAARLVATLQLANYGHPLTSHELRWNNRLARVCHQQPDRLSDRGHTVNEASDVISNESKQVVAMGLSIVATVLVGVRAGPAAVYTEDSTTFESAESLAIARATLCLMIPLSSRFSRRRRHD